MRLHRLLSAVALLLAAAATASAQTAGSGSSTVHVPSFIVRAGGLIADFNSDLRLDLTSGATGTTVSFENDLGFTRNTGTWFVDGQWRMTPRHRFYFNYVGVNRDSVKTGLSRPLTIGDQTFQIGATVAAFVDTSYLSFDYGFALVKNQKADIVATIGMSSVKVHTGAGLEAQATSGQTVSRSLSTDAEDRSIFPVPGVQFSFKLHQYVAITGYTRFIKATLGGIKESSTDGRVGIEFPLSNHVGGGVAYYFNHVMEEGSNDTFTGKLRYTFRGPQLYGLIHF
jgi:hypothetical protein